jgi:hypothetical protein
MDMDGCGVSLGSAQHRRDGIKVEVGVDKATDVYLLHGILGQALVIFGYLSFSL